MESLIVTIDGPAGSGKSTVARRLAARLGLEFLDTGAMYRGLAAWAIDHGLEVETQSDQLVALAQQADLRFDWTHDPPRLSINGRDIMHRLRDPDTTRAVSIVAQISPIRQVLVEAQRRIGKEHPRLVTEGRDQGSVVFPDAQVKFYLEARPDVRARRRALEMRAAGKVVDEQRILVQIIERDDRDMNREDGPLRCAPDARRIDTSDMALPQVVSLLEQFVRDRAGQALGTAAGAGG